jgi:hypothetical protein
MKVLGFRPTTLRRFLHMYGVELRAGWLLSVGVIRRAHVRNSAIPGQGHLPQAEQSCELEDRLGLQERAALGRASRCRSNWAEEARAKSNRLMLS